MVEIKQLPQKLNIGILTFPIGNAGIIPTSHLVEILYPLSNELYLITGNKGNHYFEKDPRLCVYGLIHKKSNNLFYRALQYFIIQSKISFNIITTFRKVEVWIFFIGGNSLILPMIFSKLLRKRVILALAGSSALSMKNESNLLLQPVKMMSQINYLLADDLILYGSNLIEEWNLFNYSNKISIAHEHFLDFNIFYEKKAYSERSNQITFVGRLSSEKGILNFIESIPLILEKNDKLNFILIGDGELKDAINQWVIKNNLTSKVRMCGWIDHEDLPNYLNNSKLVVVPSYTEGLPNLILECMACGTPILATSVGAIPDIIVDAETGFLMKDNMPITIERNVTRALNHKDLLKIISKANKFVKMYFSFDNATKMYNDIIYK